MSKGTAGVARRHLEAHLLPGVQPAVLAALGLTRTMSKLLLGASPSDSVTYVAVVILLVPVALAACWIPACRATPVDPIIAQLNQ